MTETKNEYGQPIGVPVEGWEPAPFPAKVMLIGRYCRLEPLNADWHAEQLYQAHITDRNDRDWTYLPYGPFDQFEPYQEMLQQFERSDDPLFYAIVDPESGQAVGVASYLRIQPQHGVIEVGHIHFASPLKGTRAATEAMYLMMRHAFDEMGYRRYEWKCDSLNAPSRQAALRFGFRFEGEFRQAVIYKGRNRDTSWFSIVDSEWPALKMAYEMWLDPSNFSEGGRQINHLYDLIEQVRSVYR